MGDNRMGSIVFVSGSEVLLRAGGRSVLERTLAMLERDDCAPVCVVCPQALVPAVREEVQSLGASSPVFGDGARSAVANALPADDGELMLLVEAGILFDKRLIASALAWTAESALVDSAAAGSDRPEIGGRSFVGLAALSGGSLRRAIDAKTPLSPAALVGDAALRVDDIADMPTYSREHRRDVRPFWLAVRDRDDVLRARKILVDAASKGHMEWVVLILNRPVEKFLSYFVSEWRITPNQITAFGILVAAVATWLFAIGSLWPAIAVAVIAGILDGLDGRQARIQLKTSRLGEFEHVFDKITEGSWMLALAWYFSDGFADRSYLWLVVLWALAYAADNLSYSYFRAKRGMTIDEASPLDAAIRFVAGRRNTNIAYLAIGHAFGVALEAYWFVVVFLALTAIVHWGRIAQHLSRSTPSASSPPRLASGD